MTRSTNAIKVVYTGDREDLSIVAQRMRYSRIGYMKSFRKVPKKKDSIEHYRLEAYFATAEDARKIQNYLKLYWRHELIQTKQTAIKINFPLTAGSNHEV